MEKDMKTDKVFEYIYEGIKTGEFPPGQMLTERGIVGSLGVSRTPVREALRRLEKYGLIESKPHKGARVISMSKSRVQQLYQVREVLEGLGARLLAEKQNEEVVLTLENLLTEAGKAAKEGDIDKLSRINGEFHMKIAEMSENLYLLDIMTTLQTHIQLGMLTSLSNKDRPSKNIEEHKLVVDAIKSGDGEFAEAAIKSHVRNSYKKALQQLDSE